MSTRKHDVRSPCQRNGNLLSGRPMKALLLAGVLAIFAASAAQAGGGVVGSDFRSGASAASTTSTAGGQRPSGDQKVRESGDGGGVTSYGAKPGVAGGQN